MSFEPEYTPHTSRTVSLEKTNPLKSGIDRESMDETVKPGMDFFQYANGGWLRNNTIPENEGRWGTFKVLHIQTIEKLRTLITSLDTKAKKSSPDQQVGDAYRASADMEKRNTIGIEPLLAELKKIDQMNNPKKFIAIAAEFEKKGVSFFWGMGVFSSFNDSKTNTLHMAQGGLGLPDREYYLEDTEEYLTKRASYVEHVRNMFMLTGAKENESTTNAVTILKIETAVAKAWMDKVTRRDPLALNNVMTLAELQVRVPDLDWKNYFKLLGIPTIESVVVHHADFFVAVARLIMTLPIEELKVFMKWNVIQSRAGILNSALYDESFRFHATVLGGIKEQHPQWRKSLADVDGMLPDQLGELYVKAHFLEESKQRVMRIIADVKDAFRNRIERLDWMSPETKLSAKKKLDAMDFMIGSPDVPTPRSGIDIKSDDHFGNVIRVNAFEYQRAIAKIGKPVDKKEWGMSAPSINAYYSPLHNQMVFPAGILQPPFFNPDADDAVNYGAIGSVIAHEMTHGFDDEGSKYDKDGNLREWWNNEDRAKFDTKTGVLVSQYNACEVDGAKVNGKMTLGENIADLGGVVIAFEALQIHLKRSGNTAPIDGFTPEQRFFIGYARTEAALTRPELARENINNDVHSPNKFRVNIPLSNMPEFQKAFGIADGEPMTRKVNDRAVIW